jgi:hypothetical protein
MPEDNTQEVTRQEVRPGLTMVRRRTLKEDGRYLIYYDFERAAGPGAAQETSDGRSELPRA